MSRYVLTQQIEEGKPEKGIVPVELSMTLMGISGLTVAKAFKIARGILPEKIRSNFGFIITGLEHDIGTQWTTKIKTQFYTLKASKTVSEALQNINKQKRANQISTIVNRPVFETSDCFSDTQEILATSKVNPAIYYTLADLSCNTANPGSRHSLPKSQFQHGVHGLLSRASIKTNLILLARNVIIPIKEKYPTLIVTSGYRYNNNGSQHELGQAVDIQFTDILGKGIERQNKLMFERAQIVLKLLQESREGFDQFLLEYKTTGTQQPWIHISFRSRGRKQVATFLNDKTFKQDQLVQAI